MIYNLDPLKTFCAWADAQPLVRAVILTSTRAVPDAVVDVFSDYDIILALADILPFHASRAWLEAFGTVLALYQDPLMDQNGFQTGGYVVQFEEGLKIDFTLWPVKLLDYLAAAPELPDELDAGYRVLLDKDGITASLKPPSYRAFIPKPPDEKQYRETIEVFFTEAFYIAKYLRRGDVVAAKYIQDGMQKQEHLIPMLVWHMEIEHGWKIKPGLYGRRLQQYLRPDLYTALESTYTGTSLAEGRLAIERSNALMLTAGIEVGLALGFQYPEDLHRRAVAYIRKIFDE